MDSASAAVRIGGIVAGTPVLAALGLQLKLENRQHTGSFKLRGGGGLIAGIGAYLKGLGAATEIVAVSPERSPVMHESLRQGRIVELEAGPTLSDATVGGVEEGSITFDLCRQLIDRSLLVSEDEIAAAMRRVHQATGEVIEGAAGVAVAGALADRRVGERAVVVCGGNVMPDVWERVISS